RPPGRRVRIKASASGSVACARWPSGGPRRNQAKAHRVSRRADGMAKKPAAKKTRANGRAKSQAAPKFTVCDACKAPGTCLFEERCSLTKGKPGRPTLYTKEIADEILTWLSDGKSLRSYCQQEGKPDKATVIRWLAVH